LFLDPNLTWREINCSEIVMTSESNGGTSQMKGQATECQDGKQEGSDCHEGNDEVRQHAQRDSPTNAHITATATTTKGHDDRTDNNTNDITSVVLLQRMPPALSSPASPQVTIQKLFRTSPLVDNKNKLKTKSLKQSNSARSPIRLNSEIRPACAFTLLTTNETVSLQSDSAQPQQSFNHSEVAATADGGTQDVFTETTRELPSVVDSSLSDNAPPKRRRLTEEERQQREAEKQQKRELKLKQKQERELQRKKREEEKLQKKLERRQKREEKERQRKLKEEERQRKQEEKRQREEEKKRREEERERERKRQEELRAKQSAILTNFVKTATNSTSDRPSGQCPVQTSEQWNELSYYQVNVGDFKAWQPPDGVRLPSPPSLRQLTSDARRLFEEIVRYQPPFEVSMERFLADAKRQRLARGSTLRHSIAPCKRRIEERKKRYKNIVDLDSASDAVSELIKRLLLQEKFKFFKFYENVRPPYFGTFTKRSAIVRPRRPFAKDHTLVPDYDNDSDDEWEEEEGEDLEAISENEKDAKETEDDYDFDDEFLVADDYLSDSEGLKSDDEGPNSTEENTQKSEQMKSQLKEKLVEKTKQNLKRRDRALVSLVTGPVFHLTSLAVDESTKRLLSQWVIQPLTPQVPIFIQTPQSSEENRKKTRSKDSPAALTTQDTSSEHCVRSADGEGINCGSVISSHAMHTLRDGTDDRHPHKRVVPDHLLPELARMVHGATCPRETLVTQFLARYPKQGISKRQVELKITEIATKEKRKGWACPAWFVKPKFLLQFGLDEVTPPLKTLNAFVLPTKNDTLPAPCQNESPVACNQPSPQETPNK
jgi:hypothetical protein